MQLITIKKNIGIIFHIGIKSNHKRKEHYMLDLNISFTKSYVFDDFLLIEP